MSYDDKKASGMAEKMGKNASAEDINNVAEKMDGMKKGPLAKIWDKVIALWNGFKSPETPAYMKAIIIGGLIYMVSPIDIIPDMLPGGLLDDAGVIAMTFSKFVKIAAFGTVACTVIKLAKLTISSIRKYLKSHNPKAKYFKILEQKITKNFNDKNYNRVNVGLYDEDKNRFDKMSFESENLDSNLEEGVMYNVN